MSYQTGDEQDEQGHARRLAAADQANMQIVDTVPPFLGCYFKALLVQGFSADQAFILARDYQYALLQGSR